MIEALTGLLIFSWILSFYLPGLNQELRVYNEMNLENQEWKLFYQLVDIQLSEMPRQKKVSLIQSTIRDNQLLYSMRVSDFSCNIDTCAITFERGSAYQIELQEIQSL